VAQQSEGHDYIVFGLFLPGTSRDVVKKSIYPGDSVSPPVLAYGAGTPDNLIHDGFLTGTPGSTMTLSGYLDYLQYDGNIAAYGTFDAWFVLINGSTWTGYKKENLTVTGDVTLNISQFTRVTF
jgi:hypothetical protein